MFGYRCIHYFSRLQGVVHIGDRVDIKVIVCHPTENSLSRKENNCPCGPYFSGTGEKK